MKKVHNVFGTIGRFEDGAAGGFARSYKECAPGQGRVYIEFSAAQGQQARLGIKRWRAPVRGAMQVLEGTVSADSFDLVNRPVRSERLYARGGADYVFIDSDGFKDVVRCGPGRDLVHLLGPRDAEDVFIGCEQVKPYSS